MQISKAQFTDIAFTIFNNQNYFVFFTAGPRSHIQEFWEMNLSSTLRTSNLFIYLTSYHRFDEQNRFSYHQKSVSYDLTNNQYNF